MPAKISDTIFEKHEVRNNLSLNNIIYLKDNISREEKWLPVIDYEGCYMVSELGRIKMLKRKFSNQWRDERIVTQTINPWGYLYVELSNANFNRKKIFTHVVVSKAWIPNIDKKPCVNHEKGQKWDNRVSELSWVTRSENTLHAFRTGLLKVNKTALGKKGELSPHSIKIDQLDMNGLFIKQWSSQSEAAETLRLSQGNIFSAMNGRYKSTGGFKWRYSQTIQDAKNTL